MTVELESSPAQALQAVGEAVEMWGGDWQPHGSGGQATIPVSAGIRHGYIAGQISTRQRSDKVEVALHVERTHYQLHWQSLVVLSMGAVGGLFIVVVPFFPVLFPLVPAGVMLSLAAWFLVVARVRTRGLTEFFELVSELVETPPPPD